MAEVVVDASAMVDLLLDNELGAPFVGGSRVTRCTHRRTSTPRFSLRWDDCIVLTTAGPMTSSPGSVISSLLRSSATM